MSRRRSIPGHWTPVQEAAYLTIHDYGVADLAQLVGKAPRVLDNEVNPEMTRHKLGLDDSVVYQHAAGDPRILHAMARALRHVCLPLPDELRNVSDEALLDAYAHYHAEMGETAAKIREALDDGAVSAAEFREVEREFYEDVQAGFELLNRLRELLGAQEEGGR